MLNNEIPDSPDLSVRKPIRFLVFSASLRTGSFNTELAQLAARLIEQHGGTVELAKMADFNAPPYDQDTQDADGFPPGAETFRRCLEDNDAFVIASPEYNASFPGLLKNTIDWVSCYRPQPFKKRHCLLISASPSMRGGNRGLWALRIPLENLGAHVYPEMFSLAQANEAFDADGEIADPQLCQRFDLIITDFMDLVEADKYYFVKKAWSKVL